MRGAKNPRTAEKCHNPTGGDRQVILTHWCGGNSHWAIQTEIQQGRPQGGRPFSDAIHMGPQQNQTKKKEATILKVPIKKSAT